MRPEPGPVHAVWRALHDARHTDALAEVDPPARHGALVRVVGGALDLVVWSIEVLSAGVGLVLDAIDLVAWSIEVVLSTACAPLRWAWGWWHVRK